jgi:hypothetical protein
LNNTGALPVNDRLRRIRELEGQIRQLLADLNALSAQDQQQYSPLVKPSKISLQELKRQLDLLLSTLGTEEQTLERDTRELQPTEIVQEVPTTEELQVKTHEVPTSPTTTISVAEEEPLGGTVSVHQEETIPALVGETTTIVEQKEEPQLQETTEHAEVYAPPEIATTVSLKEEEFEGEPFLVKEEQADKRTPKEKIQDLLENTESLLKDGELSPSELVSSYS